jgi:hypothetical protein|tara:strand:+ start:613 stop:1410 length:798 start_codon:yes stop_codon:yes gene_type:complete
MKKKNVYLTFTDKEMGTNDGVRGMVKIFDTSTVYHLEGNRDLDESTIADIRKSVKKAGNISTIIVIVDKFGKLLCIDGQHRFENGLRNNETITATIVEPKVVSNEAMKLLNICQHVWRPLAYLNNGITYHKNQDYVFLREMMEDTGITLIALYKIFSFDNTDTFNKKCFEDGSWKVTTKSLGNKTIRYAEQLVEETPMKFALKSDFLRGFVRCVARKNYSQEHMVKQAKKYPNHIHVCKNPNQYVEMMNKLYNWNALETEQEYLA